MTEKTAKAPNYTEEQTRELVAAYKAAAEAKDTTQESREAVVTAFAAKFGKDVKSIRAKLSREGVYIKKTYTKKGETAEGKPANKDTLSDELTTLCGLSENEGDSLTKANRTALVKILNGLKAGMAAIAKLESLDLTSEEQGEAV